MQRDVRRAVRTEKTFKVGDHRDASARRRPEIIFIAELEDKLRAHLSNPWVKCCGKGAKGSFTRTELRKVTGGGALVKVDVVEDIEKLATQLEGNLFCYFEILGQPQVPKIETWKTEGALTGIAERAGVVSSEASKAEPVLAGLCETGAGSGAVGGADYFCAVQSDCGAGPVNSRQDREWPAALSLNETADLPIAQDMPHDRVPAFQTRQLPNVRAHEAVGVIEFRRSPVKLMS